LHFAESALLPLHVVVSATPLSQISPAAVLMYLSPQVADLHFTAPAVPPLHVVVSATPLSQISPASVFGYPSPQDDV
jgi:hypothetical protein